MMAREKFLAAAQQWQRLCFKEALRAGITADDIDQDGFGYKPKFWDNDFEVIYDQWFDLTGEYLGVDQVEEYYGEQ